MSSPYFSIIIPTHRAEAVIAACLVSIARQTFKDFEIIVMDGKSDDKTVEIVSNHLARFNGRLTVHSEKDDGIYDVMNKGIQRAKGNWLYFIGADDCLHDSSVLETVAAFIRRQPDSDVVYGDVIMKSDASRYAGAFDLERLLLEGNLCHQAIFYRRTVFEKIGAYNLRYRVWADWDLNIRCFQHPDFKNRYLDLVVADYNNVDGFSSRQSDHELRKILPLWVRNGTSIRYLLRLKAANLFRKITGN